MVVIINLDFYSTLSRLFYLILKAINFILFKFYFNPPARQDWSQQHHHSQAIIFDQSAQPGALKLLAASLLR